MMEVESVKGERETTGGGRGRFRCDRGKKTSIGQAKWEKHRKHKSAETVDVIARPSYSFIIFALNPRYCCSYFIVIVRLRYYYYYHYYHYYFH